MRMKFEEVFNSATFVGYVEDVQPILGEGAELEKFFPVRTVDGLDYSYIKTANSAIELTAPSAFDAEPIAQHREGFDAMKGELPLFRRKMNLSEKEKSMLKLYMQANNQDGVNRLLTQIFDDQMTLVKGAMMTQEFLRARALMDGKITIASKGGAVAVDYKVPAVNKYTLSGTDVWSDPTAKIIDKITSALDKVEDATGVRPTRMIMNRNTFRLLRTNKQIQENMLPLGIMASATVQANAVITDVQIMATFKALTGLTEVLVYNKKVQMDGVLYDLVEDNKVAIVPEGELGNTMIGTSPAELNMADANASGAQISIMGNGLAVNTYTNTQAPYTSGTEIEFIGLPSFLASDRVVLMTVA
ncbi:MAG: major capsid protein [Paraclostridium sp.]